ncbi:hypothetical protein [Arthrobacter castelli]|uniref:hypothetical protein n=1 Tax=Arthrobacter castelli TaxID=271431 RepID=UPI000408FDB7|nr:hypothetical protein [Arthrobacter castelli]
MVTTTAAVAVRVLVLPVLLALARLPVLLAVLPGPVPTAVLPLTMALRLLTLTLLPPVLPPVTRVRRVLVRLPARRGG